MEKIEISAFKENENIPEEYSCDGKDISPEIKIVDASPEKYYMIIMNDPDAPVGLFTHWVIYNINSKSGVISKGIENKKITKEGFYQGKNDFGKIGYGGSCPPKGDKPHRYFFNLYLQKSFINEDEISVKRAYEIASNLEKLSSYMGIYKR